MYVHRKPSMSCGAGVALGDEAEGGKSGEFAIQVQREVFIRCYDS